MVNTSLNTIFKVGKIRNFIRHLSSYEKILITGMVRSYGEEARSTPDKWIKFDEKWLARKGDFFGTASVL